jgi:protocatechuate 3,4-dioxygenase beta subunit
MKTRLSVVAIALSTLVAGHALAADPSFAKTREQVRAELVEAQRNGDLIADGETGLRFNQVSPHLYPQATVVASTRAADPAVAVVAQGKTRAEVKAELAEAQANGDLIADGETGARFKDVFPGRYPVQATVQAKSRDDVRAELVKSRAVSTN